MNSSSRQSGPRASSVRRSGSPWAAASRTAGGAEQVLDGGGLDLRRSRDRLMAHSPLTRIARDRQATLELFAEELRLAHEHVASITGEFTTDDLLGEIFSRFCIGK